MAIFKRIVLLGNLVRFSHTIFALPFAIMGAILAADGLPDLETILLILLAMVGARSAATPGKYRLPERTLALSTAPYPSPPSTDPASPRTCP